MRGSREGFVGDPADLLELLHEVGFGVEAASGVYEDDVTAAVLGSLDGVEDDGCGIAATFPFHKLYFSFFSPFLELFGGSGSKGICSSHEDLFPFGGVPLGQLGDGGGLAVAIGADNKDHVGLGSRTEGRRREHGGGEFFFDLFEDGLHGDIGTLFVEFSDGVGEFFAGFGAEISLKEELLELLDSRFVDLTSEEVTDFLTNFASKLKHDTSILAPLTKI